MLTCPYCETRDWSYERHRIYFKSYTDFVAHKAERHPHETIAERLRQIVQAAKHAPDTLEYWQSGPLSVEWRALLRQWWALPGPVPVSALELSPTGGHGLTYIRAPLSAGEAYCRTIPRRLREMQP